MHVPRNTKIIEKDELEKIGNNKVIINTCLENIYQNIDTVRLWFGNEHNFSIRNHRPGIKEKPGDLERFIYTENVIVGITIEARKKLSIKIIDNIKAYLKDN